MKIKVWFVCFFLLFFLLVYICTYNTFSVLSLHVSLRKIQFCLWSGFWRLVRTPNRTQSMEFLPGMCLKKILVETLSERVDFSDFYRVVYLSGDQAPFFSLGPIWCSY